ncbi:hypothetical protein D3C72_1844920 [compost metagenome]
MLHFLDQNIHQHRVRKEAHMNLYSLSLVSGSRAKFEYLVLFDLFQLDLKL